MSALSTYQTQTQRLLHDANGTFWSLTEITDYVNSGRSKTASLCKCLRYLETSASANLTAGTESYAISTVSTKGVRAIDILNITVLWGNQRIPLFYMPWTQFNAMLRTWSQFQSRPVAWSRQGTSIGNVFIGPIPDQTYSSEWDIAYLPADLVDGTSVDELIYPFTDPVPYYAAYLAKFKEQSYGESAVFEKQFNMKAISAVNAVFTRYMPNVYGSHV